MAALTLFDVGLMFAASSGARREYSFTVAARTPGDAQSRAVASAEGYHNRHAFTLVDASVTRIDGPCYLHTLRATEAPTDAR